VSSAPPDITPEPNPGGTMVVFALFAIVAAPLMLIAVFIFPPAYVAAVLAFGPVTLLGGLTLVVHFRS